MNHIVRRDAPPRLRPLRRAAAVALRPPAQPPATTLPLSRPSIARARCVRCRRLSRPTCRALGVLPDRATSPAAADVSILAELVRAAAAETRPCCTLERTAGLLETWPPPKDRWVASADVVLESPTASPRPSRPGGGMASSTSPGSCWPSARPRVFLSPPATTRACGRTGRARDPQVPGCRRRPSPPGDPQRAGARRAVASMKPRSPGGQSRPCRRWHHQRARVQ